MVAYICPICKMEFQAPRPTPSGLSMPIVERCPNGHRLRTVRGFWSAVGGGILVTVPIIIGTGLLMQWMSRPTSIFRCPYQKVDLPADRRIPRRDLNAGPAADPLGGLTDTDGVAHVVPDRGEGGCRCERVGVFRCHRTVPGTRGGARVQRAGGAWLRRAAFVSMVETADFRDPHDVALPGRHHWTGNRRILVQPQVSSGFLVVRAVARHQRSHPRFVERNHVIEALAPRGSHKSLHKRILPRGVRARDHVLNPHRLRGGLEVVKGVIAIVNQIPRRLVPRKRVAQLLGRPRRRRMRGDRHVSDASPIVGEEHQDKHEAAGHSRDHEEIGRHDLADVIAQERAPRL
jgi:hypothetical protein